MSEKSLTGHAGEEGFYILARISAFIAICYAACVNPRGIGSSPNLF